MQIIIDVTTESAQRLKQLGVDFQTPIALLIASTMIVGAEEICADKIEVREGDALVSYFANS